MMILFKILIAVALIGPGIYLQEPILMVLTAPIAAVIFSPDILNFCIGSVRAMRHHAFKSDTRVFQFGYYQVRLIEWLGRPWFSAIPVCGALGHRDVEAAINYYATTDYCVYGTKKEQFLTAHGVLRLAELSRHPDAAKFRHWFENDVLGTLPDDLRRRARLKPPGITSASAAASAAAALAAESAPETAPAELAVAAIAPVALDAELKIGSLTKLDIEL